VILWIKTIHGFVSCRARLRERTASLRRTDPAGRSGRLSDGGSP
jgi:hypothetical protein